MNTDKLETFILCLLDYRFGSICDTTTLLQRSDKLNSARKALQEDCGEPEISDKKTVDRLINERYEAIESLRNTKRQLAEAEQAIREITKQLAERTDERDNAFAKLDELRECNRRVEQANRSLSQSNLTIECEKLAVLADNEKLKQEIEKLEMQNTQIVGISNVNAGKANKFRDTIITVGERIQSVRLHSRDAIVVSECGELEDICREAIKDEK